MGQRLGQHFLTNEMVVEQIAEQIFELQQKVGASRCMEIGPGRAVLTSYLIDRFDELVLFEIDQKLKKRLDPFEKQGKAQIFRGDILQHTWAKNTPKPAFERLSLSLEPSKTLVVGNLPYYITSPILRKFFADPLLIEQGMGEGFAGGVFLVQKEVADKLISKTKKKSYLRRLLNGNYHIEYCFTVVPTSFTPPPKVDSAVIRLERIPPQLPLEKFKRLLLLLDILSPYKRKTLGKISKMEHDALTTLGVTFWEDLTQKRLEELTRENMNALL